VRSSNIFEKSSNIRPTNFALSHITLTTSHEYRNFYPGRALVEVDNVRSTTFPALPVFADKSHFEYLYDTHAMQPNSKLYVDPFYKVNGTDLVNETIREQNRIASKPLVRGAPLFRLYCAIVFF